MDSIKPFHLQDSLSLGKSEFERLNQKWDAYASDLKQFSCMGFPHTIYYHMKIYRDDILRLCAKFVLYKPSDKIVFGVNLEFGIPSAHLNVKKIEKIFEAPTKSIHKCDNQEYGKIYF